MEDKNWKLENNGFLYQSKKIEESKEMEKEIEKPEIKKLSDSKKKEEVEKFNKNPSVKENGLILVSKWFYYTNKILLIVILIAFLTLLIVNVFMFNKNFKDKDFSSKVENINNIDSPDIPVNIDNNAEIKLNATLNLNINKIEVNQNCT